MARKERYICSVGLCGTYAGEYLNMHVCLCCILKSDIRGCSTVGWGALQKPHRKYFAYVECLSRRCATNEFLIE